MIKVALIGANGQLGTDIQKVFDRKSWKIYPLTHKSIEIKDPQSIDKALKSLSIDMVINTAAFHNVDVCEDRPEEAFAVNAIGVRNLCLWCREYDKTLVHLSSDYVFGREGERSNPYEEENTPGPINVYGTSKAAGEFFVRLLKRYFLIRTSGLFGVAGSSGKGGNFIETMIRKARSGEHLRLVNDQILSPTFTKNLAQNLELLLLSNSYGLYHMASHGQCSWFEMTQKILSLLHLDVSLSPITTSQSKAVATRPAYSALANTELQKLGIDRMNSWQDNLRLYLVEKGYLS